MNGFTLTASLLLVLGLTIGQTLGQTPVAPNSDELRFRDERDSSTPSSDTNVIEDVTPSTPQPADGTTDRPLVQPIRPTDNQQQQQDRRPFDPLNIRPHPRPFNPFGFLLGPPPMPFGGPMGPHRHHAANDDDDDDFFGMGNPFRSSPLMNLLGGNGGPGSLLRPANFRLPSPADFRAQMDKSIRELEGKPDVWAKEVQRYSVNGVQYEVIKFTRKVQDQRPEVPQIDGQASDKQANEQQSTNNQDGAIPAAGPNELLQLQQPQQQQQGAPTSRTNNLI